MPSCTLDDDVELIHKHTNHELVPTKKPRFLRTKTGCWDCLSVTGIIPLKAEWLVGMHGVSCMTGGGCTNRHHVHQGSMWREILPTTHHVWMVGIV